MARMRNDWSLETGSIICQLIEIHPWLDRLWLLLAEYYRNNSQFPQEYWCLVKAENTESSVNISDVHQFKDQNPLSPDIKLQINTKVLQNISIPKQNRKNAESDFVDLGSSLNMKEHEEAMAKIKLTSSEQNCDIIVQNFEKKWFAI